MAIIIPCIHRTMVIAITIVRQPIIMAIHPTVTTVMAILAFHMVIITTVETTMAIVTLNMVITGISIIPSIIGIDISTVRFTYKY